MVNQCYTNIAYDVAKSNADRPHAVGAARAGALLPAAPGVVVRVERSGLVAGREARRSVLVRGAPRRQYCWHSRHPLPVRLW